MNVPDFPTYAYQPPRQVVLPFPAGAWSSGGALATLDPFIYNYLRERRRRSEIVPSSARDMQSRLTSLSKSFGNRPLQQMGERAIERWLESIADMRPSSRRSYLSTVHKFMGWMVRRGHLRIDPTVEIARIREPRRIARALSAAKVAQLVRSLPDARAQAIVWLMVSCGLRCCEVAGLDVNDYDPVARTLFVRGKGSHERMLPVPTILAGALNMYLDESGWQASPLIKHLENSVQGLTAGTVSRIVGQWMLDSGVKHHRGDGISAHSLRHTAASDVLDKCGSVQVVQAMLGHANIATTSLYLRRASLGQMRDAMEGRTYREDNAA